MLLGLTVMTSGCASMFVSGRSSVQTGWQSFEAAHDAFKQVVPGTTRKDQLAALGFDPFVNPNVRVLSYLDVQNRFLPNTSIRLADLPEPVREFLAARERSLAYEVDVTVTRSKRHGNLFLDVFSFNRKTEETGWSFKALVLLNGEQVVYKLWSGQPRLLTFQQKKRPLGPLQELEASIVIPTVR